MPDPRRLLILTELRKRRRVSLAQMARACGLVGNRGYESASAWERGVSTPHSQARIHFVTYLAHTLGLAADRPRLEAVWDVLVEEWSWEPLQPADWRVIGQRKEAAATTSSSVPREGAAGERSAGVPTSSGLPAPGLLPSGSRILLTPNPHFVGRTAELFALAEALTGNPAGPHGRARQVIVAGPGGIGKTQIAIEFAHRFGRGFAGGVFWLSFANAEAVPSLVAACGGAGGLDLRPDFAQLTLDQQVKLVRAAWEEPVPRLLVFDNCEDPKLVQRWRPERGGCRVLVTSQWLAWPHDIGSALLSLGLLTRAESVRLLRSYNPSASLSDELLTAVAVELDDLPLALHLAGSYLAYGGDASAPERYLAEVRATLATTAPAADPHPSLAGIGPYGRLMATPTGHRNHLDQTVALSVARLASSEPPNRTARAVLERAAWFAPGEPIPSELLLATLSDRVPADDGRHALDRLASTGLLTLDHQGQAQIARLHRLVVSFVRRHAADPEGQTAVERVLLARLRQHNATDDHPALVPLQSHLLSVTDAALARGDLAAAELASELSWHLHQTGTTKQTLHYNKCSLAIRSRILGEQHPDLAINLHTMGWTYDSDGDYPTALALHQQGLALRRNALGECHRDVAVSRNYLGMVLHARSAYQEARQQYEEALTIQLALEPVDQAEVAELRNNLGLLSIAQGRLAEALPQLEAALALREAARPINGSLLAVTLNNLGYAHRALGEYSAARPYLQRALRLREEIFGPAKPYVAVTLNHLGRLEHALGNYTVARRHLGRALEIRQQTFHGQHPETANSLGNLGMLHFDQGDYTSAKTYLQAALAMHEALYGDEHRHTARSLNHLGVLWSATGAQDDAERCFRRALAIREQLLGAEHHDTANTAGLLGALVLEQGKLGEATALIERALAAHRAGLGEEHLYTARSQVLLARLRRVEGRAGEALAAATEARAIYERRLGVEHPWVAWALVELAAVQRQHDDTETAQMLLLAALHIRERRLGSQHPATLWTRAQLAAL
jgi:tetratricopeptide (TPR) repeat protein/transcriptional regulator with XRE-family HTH domain